MLRHLRKRCTLVARAELQRCISAYYNNFRYWKLSQCQHVLLLWWSSTVATILRPLKSGLYMWKTPSSSKCSQDLYTHIWSDCTLNCISDQTGWLTRPVGQMPVPWQGPLVCSVDEQDPQETTLILPKEARWWCVCMGGGVHVWRTERVWVWMWWQWGGDSL